MEPIIAALIFIVGAAAAVVIPTTVVVIRLVKNSIKFKKLPLSGALSSTNGPDAADVDAALIDYIDEWGRRFGGDRQKLADAFDGLTVEWVDGDYFENVHKGKKRQLRGLTVDSSSIKVAERNGKRIGQTAFFHELTHVACWAVYGEPDADHAQTKWIAWTAEHDSLIAVVKKKWV